ncbi:MAG: hypothetical protein A4C66_04550 [Nitrospira sp. HN-bin3]|nr:MAG: hypothetical protein A4C66_04550 [Nitrospira sp. HN-bin3]
MSQLIDSNDITPGAVCAAPVKRESLEDSMICSCGCVLVLVPDAEDEGGCCGQGVRLICPWCVLPHGESRNDNRPLVHPNHRAAA